jgi:hypothetical protein
MVYNTTGDLLKSADGGDKCLMPSPSNQIIARVITILYYTVE